MSTDNQAIVQQVFDAVERGDIEALQALYATDVEILEAPSLPYGGVYAGLDGLRAHASAYVATWDHLQRPGDWRLDARLLSAGEHVAGVWRQRATSPAGERLDSPAVSLFRVRNGRVRRVQMFHFDTAGLLGFLDRVSACR